MAGVFWRLSVLMAASLILASCGSSRTNERIRGSQAKTKKSATSLKPMTKASAGDKNRLCLDLPRTLSTISKDFAKRIARVTTRDLDVFDFKKSMLDLTSPVRIDSPDLRLALLNNEGLAYESGYAGDFLLSFLSNSFSSPEISQQGCETVKVQQDDQSVTFHINPNFSENSLMLETSESSLRAIKIHHLAADEMVFQYFQVEQLESCGSVDDYLARKTLALDWADKPGDVSISLNLAKTLDLSTDMIPAELLEQIKPYDNPNPEQIARISLDSYLMLKNSKLKSAKCDN